MKAILFLICLFSLAVNASESLEAFNKRFRVIRDEEGRALRIIDRSLHTRLSFIQFATTYHKWFIQESPNLLEGDQFISLQSEIESRELARELRAILDEVKEYNLAALINGNGFKKIDEFLISEFKKVSTVGFRTVSNLENTTFFYQDKHYRKISESAKKETQKFFPKVKEEEIVSYLVERYIGFLRDSRSYHQSILLHYLTNFEPAALSLSLPEVGMAVSSILEGDIKIHNILSRRRLKRNWATYGFNKLKEIADESLNTALKFRELYSQTPFFANPYFAKTITVRGEEVWINPYFQNKALDNSPSLSFNYSRPAYVYKSRRYLELFLFSDIQSKNSGKVKRYFTNLKYRRQMLKEGMLFGFYESKDNQEMMQNLLKQSLNPLETIFKIPL